MGDLNCSIGSVLSDAIGEAGSEIEDEGGECLRELCNDFQFALPCTSDVLHCGEHWTHQSVQGTRARLDYIVTPADCISAIKSSYIDDEIDVLNGDRDHRVVALEVGIIETDGMKFGTVRKPLYDREAASRAKRQGRSSLLEDLPLCDWNADVNKHWSIVRGPFASRFEQIHFPNRKDKKGNSISHRRLGTLCAIEKSCDKSTENCNETMFWLSFSFVFVLGKMAHVIHRMASLALHLM